MWILLSAALSPGLAFAGSCTLDAPPARRWSSLKADGRWACALDDAGALSCLDVRTCARVELGAAVADFVVQPVPCALGEDGRIRCSDPFAERRQVRQSYDRSPDGIYTAIEGGTRSACAIRAQDGGLDCWGAVLDRNAAVPTDLGWTALHGGIHMCATRPGQTRCWPADVELDRALPQLESGGRPCAIEDDGELVCFNPRSAYNPDGHTAARVPEGLAREVESSDQIVCRADPEGSVACTGGSRRFVSPPTEALHGMVAMHGLFCALNEAGAVRCWGEGAQTPPPSPEVKAAIADGRLPAIASRARHPELVWLDRLPPFDALALSGDNRGCGRHIDRSAVTCWNADGVETVLSGDGPYDRPFVAAMGSVCALDRRRRPRCAGAPRYLADLPEDKLSHFGGNREVVCGVRAKTRRLGCWGEPVRVAGMLPNGPPDVEVTELAFALDGLCALDTDGRIHCFGAQVGFSGPPPGPWVDLSISERHICGLRTDASMACWGGWDLQQAAHEDVTHLFDGQAPCVGLSDGSVECFSAATHRWKPQPQLDGIVDYAVGDRALAGCGRTADGELRCREATPPTGRDWLAIDAAEATMCALRGDGEVQCMVGQHVVGGGPTSAVDLAVGKGFACVLQADRKTVQCSGGKAAVRKPD